MTKDFKRKNLCYFKINNFFFSYKKKKEKGFLNIMKNNYQL